MADAIGAFRQALERDPTDSDSRYWLVAACGYAGLLTEAAREGELLPARDPLSPQSWAAEVIVPFFDGRFAEAETGFRRMIAAEPENFGARWCQAYVDTITGRLPAAAEQVAWMNAAVPEAPYGLQADALLRVVRGDVQGGLAQVESLDLLPYDGHLTFHFAELFAMGGQIDRALDVVALAVEKGFTPAAFIGTHCPFMAPLRDTPRFGEIVAAATARSAEVAARSWTFQL